MSKTLFIAITAIWLGLPQQAIASPMSEFAKMMQAHKQPLPPEEAEAIKAKIHAYVEDFIKRGASASNGCYEGLKRYGSSKLGYSQQQCEADIQEAAQAAQKEKAEQTAKAAQERETTISRMRSGGKAIESFEDATAVHMAVDGFSLSSAPKIRPDGRKYYLAGTIELADDKAPHFTALANNGAAGLMQKTLSGSGQGERRYFYVRLHKSMETKYYDMAKFGIGFDLVGTYSENRSYTTLAGEKKSMPVFEAVYFEFWTADKFK